MVATKPNSLSCSTAFMDLLCTRVAAILRAANVVPLSMPASAAKDEQTNLALKVKGSIEHYAPDRNDSQKKTAQFVGLISAKKWRFNVTFNRGTPASRAYGSDGTNLYAVAQFESLNLP